MRHPRRLLVVGRVVASCVFASGCSFDAVDLSDKECPCADGYTCNTTRNVCVESTTDAGIPDATPTDARPPSLCEGILSPFEFCDGFEEAELPLWEGTLQMDGDSRVVSTPTFRGMGALNAFTFDGGTLGARSSGGFSLGDGSQLFWRVYAFLPSDTTLESSIFFAVTGDVMSDVVGWGFGTAGSLALSGPADELIPGTATPFPREEWVCVQGRVRFGRDTGEIEMRWNGTTVLERANWTTLASDSFSNIVLGVLQTQPDRPPMQIYFDEFVADSNMMIPCEP